MGSAFFGIGVGTQGLYTAKTALDITNHNIANAETVGYSRQYGLQSATRPLPNGMKGMIGTGSEITNVLQHRDSYLDNKYWSMTNELGEYEVKDEILSQMEILFNEPSETGYSTFFNNIFESLQTLSKNPGDTTVRNAFVTSLESFATYMNDVSKQLTTLQKETNFGIKTNVDQINFFSQQLASLNHQIGNLELSGKSANDLRDERNRILDDLSKIVNVDTKEITDANGKKTFRVSINGQSLVYDTTANYLEVKPRTYLNNPEDQVDMYDIYWKSGKELYLNNDNLSGELKGYIDLRDGNNGENFKGAILSGEGTNTLVIDGPSRTDIPAAGEMNIGGTLITYSSATYDPILDQMTFNLDASAPAGVDGTTTFIGDNQSFKGIPFYTQELNHFVRTIAREFNTINESGNGGTGTQLFTYKGYTGVPPLNVNDLTSYENMNIYNFTVNQAVIEDLSLVETSATLDHGESANDLILKLIEKRHDTKMFEKGKPDNYMQSLLGTLGIDAKQVVSFKKGQENLMLLVTNQRLSVSGVDLNEETMNMLKFQQAYNVSAKIISVMDEIYNVTINQMGV
ncbi:Flagellar hook-associated protein 1 [Petrocella atlantisensis]|uniref:Flagellar hook-associated protein 1 n=1 Tax=Petrocella atlantisensis TaxID=2173034 RepID=A0A3P7S1H2_9FIRM|nr:flagellar hook-associated protein FlgK [Petrocella atlantisensis]VDN48532.1 Flagellar hook-associated protein 1 [Petrocella atlantisensis]